MTDLKVIETKESIPMLATFDSMLKFAETIAKSGLVPAGLDTKEKVFTAIQWGKELGLTPMVAVNNIAVVNGKPSLSTDIMHALVMSSPMYRGVQWIQQDDKRAECIVIKVYPDGTKEEVRGLYTIEDAQRADLLKKDNWEKYPTRMLKHRALSFALRDAFPDKLSGVLSAEEANEIIEEENIRNITPPPVYDEFDKAPETTEKAPATADDFN